MASAVAVASKPAPLPGLLRKLLAATSGPRHPVASVAAARRLFGSGRGPLRRRDEEEEVSGGSEDDDAVDDRRGARGFTVGPVFLSSADLLDPTKTLGGLLSKLKEAAEEASPAAAARAGRGSPAPRGWWVAKEDDDALTLKVPMPGLGKEHVKVWADQNTLVIKGEGDKETADDDDDGEVDYSRRIELPADAFKMDQVRAEMKNGLLKVTVPRVKEEERKDVFHVAVE